MGETWHGAKVVVDSSVLLPALMGAPGDEDAVRVLAKLDENKCILQVPAPLLVELHSGASSSDEVWAALSTARIQVVAFDSRAAEILGRNQRYRELLGREKGVPGRRRCVKFDGLIVASAIRYAARAIIAADGPFRERWRDAFPILSVAEFLRGDQPPLPFPKHR